MGKGKIDWRNHVLEFITVVVGILLAFALNNYNENVKSRKQAKLQFQRITEEVKANKAHLEERLKYHQELLSLLVQSPDSARLILKLSSPVDYAWQIAQNTNFKSHVDYDKIVLLEKIHNYQERLATHNESVGDHMNFGNIMGSEFVVASGSLETAREIEMNPEFRRFRKNSWVPIFQDICSLEDELLIGYDIFLKTIDK